MSTIEFVKVDLPLPATATCRSMISLWNAQSGLIKQAPGYSATGPVGTVVTDLDAAVVVLEGTADKLDQTRALVSTLETTRDNQMISVRLKHEGVATALNTASNGDPAAAQAWTGKTKERAKPAAVSADTSPPANAALAIIKSTSGSIKASCTAEAGAVCYLYQQGTDPAHPEAWAPPVMISGNTHKVAGLTVGQVVYARLGIVRRGSVQSQWTPVLQVLVR